MLAAHFFETALGQMGFVWSPHGLVRFRLSGDSKEAASAALLRGLGDVCQRSPQGSILDVVKQVQAYAEGQCLDFHHVKIDWSGVGRGDREVYACLREVKHGRTISYGDLARLARAAGGALGVGQIMARNPWPLIVPCHRVVGANGKLVGFSAPGGVTTKIRLLQLEAARPLGDERQGSFAF